MDISKVMITGTREPDERTVKLVRYALSWLVASDQLEPGAVLLQGEARGVDREAKRHWKFLGFETEDFEADWTKYGNAAGGIRNQEMVDAAPELCLAFPGPNSVGTWDAVRRASKAGIETFVLTDRESMRGFYTYIFMGEDND